MTRTFRKHVALAIWRAAHYGSRAAVALDRLGVWVCPADMLDDDIPDPVDGRLTVEDIADAYAEIAGEDGQGWWDGQAPNYVPDNILDL